MSNEKISQLPNGVILDGKLLPQADPDVSTEKVSWADVTTFINGKLTDVNNGNVAIGTNPISEGLAGNSGFTYDLSSHTVFAQNIRGGNGLVQEGVVHTDSLGNFSTSFVVNADVDSSANIDFSKINTNLLGSGYTSISTSGSNISLTNPCPTAIVVSGTGGKVLFPQMNLSNSLTKTKNTQILVVGDTSLSGSVTFTDMSDNTLFVINSGETYQGFVTDNSTANGAFTFISIQEKIPPTVLSGINHGDFTTGDVVSFAPNSTGMFMTAGSTTDAQKLQLCAADSSNPGVMTASGSQIIGGNKQFVGTCTASNLSGTNHGDFTTDVVSTSTPNATGMQVTFGSTLSPQQLQLCEASGSFPGVMTGNNQSFDGNKTFTGSVIVNTTTGGLDPPQMTTAQRTAQSPTRARIVYDTDLNQYFGWNTGSSSWIILG